MKTADLIGSEILSRPSPETRRPLDAKYIEVDEDAGSERIRNQLASGPGIEALMYYGNWFVWRTERGYSGELFQYRSRTDEFEDLDLDAAAEKAREWFRACLE